MLSVKIKKKIKRRRKEKKIGAGLLAHQGLLDLRSARSD